MTLAPSPTTALAWLIPLGGPPMSHVELVGKPHGMTIGRIEHCDVHLAADSVSRHHARIVFDGTRWRIADLNSRWGTFVNGTRLSQGRDIPLAEGDLLAISPWTFRFSEKTSARSGLLEGALESADDSIESARHVNTITLDRAPSLGDEMFALLLDAAAAMHGAADEKTLAETLIDKACKGSGLSNATVLKPAGGGSRFEVVAAGSSDGGATAYSRSLLKAASGGQVAELSTDHLPADLTNSIVSLGVRSALCVPVMLGETTAAYLYLDSRGDPNSAQRLPLRPNASAFCVALARIAGLALANLKRIEMDRRARKLEADLSAASAAQQWILPKPAGAFGPFSHTGKSRPGDFLGGDFYDVISLDEHRAAIAIGDVTGHGVTASVLMTASAGFLHADLQQSGDPAAAVNRLNEFICPRRPYGRFLTLWAGVVDLRKRLLRYVDAGHGYALLDGGAGGFHQLESLGQIPTGIDEPFCYRAVTTSVAEHGRLLLISDGIVEQQGPPTDAARPLPFGLEGVQHVAQATPPEADLIAALFDAVLQHAGQSTLADDATAVLLRW
ncbi:MAG TPA: SpoIIE family protein phosphatase [Humisphaera sp.]|nr:SpoIIE family protein phosphatase [Humisphaera sp.]